MDDYKVTGMHYPGVDQVNTTDSVIVGCQCHHLNTCLNPYLAQMTGVLSYRICPCKCLKSPSEGSVYAVMMGCLVMMSELSMHINM